MSTSQDMEIMHYKPNDEYVDHHQPKVLPLNLNVPQNSELFLIKFPLSDTNLVKDIEGKTFQLTFKNKGTLASFQGNSGKPYDIVNFDSTDPDEKVVVPPDAESKIAGKISRRISVVHYPDPKELQKVRSTDAKQVYLNSIARTSAFVTTKSGLRRNSRGSASKSSKAKSSLSELPEQSNTTKGRPDMKKSSGTPVRELSHGHSSGVSAVSSELSHGGKSKKRKHAE